MRYSNINALSLLLFLLLVLFGMSVLVLDMGLEVVEVVVERFEMVSGLG